MDNRGKRSIALDLACDAGREVFLELVEGADVFVTNIRLEALRRLRIDPKTLAERCPRLVYGLITGYGMDGPEKDRAAYDIAAFWARSGLADSLAQEGQAPPFQRGGMGDHNAGLAAAGGISAALFARVRSGRGQLVSTSLLREGLFTLSFDLSIGCRFGVGVQKADRRLMPNPAINAYQDSEQRWFWIVGLDGERHWPPLARAVGRPEWIDDARFATPEARARNAEELIAALDQIFGTRTRAEWGETFDAEKDLWWAPVQSAEEVLADPQAHAAGGFVEVPDGAGTTLLPATPVDFHETPDGPRHLAPRHMAPETPGSDTDAVLRELGRDAAAIAELRASGVVA
jgi:crotonobetainyl-CoA:carnitine CoA-transferase CaiB-like acyl-CoA transferase